MSEVVCTELLADIGRLIVLRGGQFLLVAAGGRAQLDICKLVTVSMLAVSINNVAADCRLQTQYGHVMRLSARVFAKLKSVASDILSPDKTAMQSSACT